MLKDKFPNLVIYTNVALDPYSSDGHDGIVREDGVIINDETVYQLCKAGSCSGLPEQMFSALVNEWLCWSNWHASAFCGPFREALDSNPRLGDKKAYQMNPANYREAMLELNEDESEGADILLVKPGLLHLDIIRRLRDKSALPVAASLVSGEYSMIKAGAALKMIDEEQVMMESMMCCIRKG